MFRNQVSSSDIKSVGYEGNILEIEFHSGGIYQYRDVPQSAYSALMAASSKGKYFHAYIKDAYGTPIKIR